MSKKQTNWVNLKEIKKEFTIKDVIEHYCIKLKPSGKNHVGCCPIHKGTNKKSFSVDIDGNKWNCFGDCKTGGNHLDLIQMIEYGEKSNVNARKAGLLVKEWFALSSDPPKGEAKKRAGELVREESKEDPEKEKASAPADPAPEKRNKPLKWEFLSLVKTHPWFDERGIEAGAIEHFGLGLQEKGKTIPGRIAIPIHNEAGELLSYCGRAVNEEQVEEHGKYKMPRGFYKSHVIYNLNRVDPDEKILILVESFISVWWLWQAGIKNVVSLMGSKLCPEQIPLLLQFFEGRKGGIMTFFDNDKDGETCTKQCFYELGDKLYFKRIRYDDFGKKPHHLKPDEIKQLIAA